MKKITIYNAFGPLIGILAMIGTPAMASEAQTGDPTGAPSSGQNNSNELSEIMVTATRRSSALQDTPIAVSAVNQEMIETAAPRDLGDLAKFTPNFSAAEIPGFNAASFAMRGVGQTNIIVYFEAPVAVLVDDFVVPSIQTQLLDTFDISQIEVLRGPQGTLFGKNTTGGAVTVKTKRPDLDAIGAEAKVSYGSFDTWNLNGAINVPVVEGKLAVRLVGSYGKSDGYMRNGFTYGPITGFAPNKWNDLEGGGDGRRVGGKDVFYGRAKVLWEPNPDLTALFQYEILRDRSPTPASVHTTPPGSSFLFASLGLTQQVTGDPIDLGGVSNRDGFLVDADNGHRIDVDGYYLNVDYFTGAGTISSITGYRDQLSQLANSYPSVVPEDGNGEILSLFDANRSDRHKTLQQELRFASEFDGPLNFVAGAFYSRDTIKFCVAQLLGFQDLVGSTTPFGPWNDTPYVLCNRQKGDVKALFTEVNWDLTDRLHLTLGGRYTWEKKHWQGRQQTFVQNLSGTPDPTFTWQDLGSLLEMADFKRYPSGVVGVKKSWSEPTWRMSLGYDITDDIFAYASYSRGFKSGGFNDQIGTFAPFGSNLDAFAAAAQPTNPEKADSFELGLKSQFLNNRVRFNLTGFYVDYTDVQKQLNVPLEVNGQQFQVTRFVNAAKMTVKGIEAELTGKLAKGLTLSGVLGYQHGSYDKYDAPLQTGYDLATAPLERTPKWQWAVNATYETEVASAAIVSINANVSYTGRNLYNLSVVSADRNTYLDAHTLLNATLTLWNLDKDKYVRLVGRNLTDERYLVASQIVGNLWTTDRYAPPRSFAIEAGVRF